MDQYMRILNSPRPAEIQRMSTSEIREQFLLADLFAPGEIRLVHTGLDRMIAGGIMPEAELSLPCPDQLRARFFHERRETGIINVGDPGEVIVGGNHLAVGSLECVYIGRGTENVSFRSLPGGNSAFYLLSCPAHRNYPTQRAGIADAEAVQIGNAANASCRKVHRYIHESGIESCQLVMGFTALGTGSVWNTWPPHTHHRRSEVYLYFDLGSDLVMHFLGEPEESRHVVVRDRQAALSPSWSMHCGAGTSPYKFIWGMAGENQSYDDMDAADPQLIK